MCCEEPLKKKTLLLAESGYLWNLNITNLFALNLSIWMVHNSTCFAPVCTGIFNLITIQWVKGIS